MGYRGPKSVLSKFLRLLVNFTRFTVKEQRVDGSSPFGCKVYSSHR